MDSSRETEFAERLARIEQSIALVQRSLDLLLAERSAAADRGTPATPFPEQRRAAVPAQAFHARRSESARLVETPASRRSTADDIFIAENISSWFASRSTEWWLSRLGIGFVILAVLLLYGYGIDKGWITPPIRVLAGAILGGVLGWLATRASPSPRTTAPRDLGLRELFYGGALAVWYLTVYAASVWYQLITIPTARLAFFVLGILSTWIALQERREIFGFLAVATGFATPFILTAPAGSVTELSLYVGAVTAMGLTIYLMRGWPSIVWITFIAFWATVGASRDAHRSVALTTLIVLATAAFVRVPALRRELLLLGSERYTPYPLSSAMQGFMDGLDSFAAALGGGKSASDSVVLWVLTLLSPFLAAELFESIWPTIPGQVWGVGLLLLGAAAFALVRRGPQPGTEVTHVAETAAVLWAVLGIVRIAPAPENIPLISLVATLALVWSTPRYAGARAVAKATIAIALLSLAGHELSFADVGLVHLRWALSGVATVGGAGLIAQALIEDPREKMQGFILAIAAYLTGLAVVWRALEPVWAPLVTTSYAVLGALLLILSRRPGSNPLLRHLGGATMLIVVARLLFVDLSRVETIWRVLVFLVCGALFLYTGYRMQAGTAEPEK